MPNIKSAKKRVEVTKAKTLQNKMLKSTLRSYMKKADIAISTDSETKAEAVKVATTKLDKAVSKGIIHKNAAARKKSTLARISK
jgi:small subunit ribosomal protein S20